MPPVTLAAVAAAQASATASPTASGADPECKYRQHAGDQFRVAGRELNRAGRRLGNVEVHCRRGSSSDERGQRAGARRPSLAAASSSAPNPAASDTVTFSPTPGASPTLPSGVVPTATRRLHRR